MTLERKAPLPLHRPKLATFLFERDLDFREAGKHLGRSREWVRLVCLPFDDPRRRVPDPEDIERIYTWSDGAIGPADWYPPRPPIDRSSAAEPGAAP